MRSGHRRKDPVFADEDSPVSAAAAAQDRAAVAMVQDAIRHRRIRLAFQPVVMAADPVRTAFHEGLVRVLDPTGRIIPARDFMDAVETTETGRQIDCAALDIGIQTLADRPDLRLSVNMSARSIGYPRWMRTLRRGLAAHPTVGERLILEITEGSALLLPEIVAAFMDEMQGAGVTFALDDFGAGLTSFALLRDFLFDMVKIDGRFVRGLHNDPDNRAVTAALLSVARHLDMLAVAESVERPEEAAVLAAMGVDCLQGYLYGAPSLRPPGEG